ncbi:MAG: copper amine oxidase N-terminal domain-containing protein [Epulopiscium sp.]|nr:copper amine oxidase N-terminal domain-containing protein [Candidatus Epulonipiscium sp.]
MSKSIRRKVLALMVVGAMAMPMVSFAEDRIQPGPDIVPISKEIVEDDYINEVEENNYIRFTGTISKVNERDGNISIWVDSDIEEDEYGVVFHISDKVSLWDRESEELVGADKLEEGMRIDAFYPTNTPMTMSLPPQLTPEIIVIQGEEYVGSSYVGEFNDNLVSTDNYLKLKIAEDTLLVNEEGQAVEVEDIYGKPVLVFYGAATKSIPAQTVPSKVVLLDIEEETEDAEVISETDQEEPEKVSMIALRDTAEELGYEIEWNGQERSITLTKQNQTIGIKIGDANYSLNKSLRKFGQAPELKDGVTYIESTILDIMK